MIAQSKVKLNFTFMQNALNVEATIPHEPDNIYSHLLNIF